MLRRDKSELVFRLKASPLVNAEGVVVGSMAICLDITERLKAESRVETLLQQKELLLREVHHRIKNNMSTIRGLLALHACETQSEEAVEALNEAQSRIMSMMVIYDKLYRSEDFRSIKVSDYLKDLVLSISDTFRGLHDVSVHGEYGNCILDSDSLFNLGIITAELITNAYKYAFPDDRAGKIRLSCLHNENGKRVFTFEDNGVGIPEDVLNNRRDGFGLNLIEVLVKQLKGTLQIEVGDGTRVKIIF